MYRDRLRSAATVAGGAVICALGLFCAGYVMWCSAVSSEMKGRTSAATCTTTWRGTACHCSYVDRRQIFIPRGQIPASVCQE